MRERNHRRSSRHAERGSLILPIAFMILLMFGLSLGFLQEGAAERTSLDHHESSMHALEIAEMGLARSEVELRGGTDVDGDGLGDLAGPADNGDYEIEAVQDTANPRIWTLTALGTYGLSERRIEVRLEMPFRPFTSAMFGKDYVDMSSGGATDSWDSRLGTYAAQATSVDSWGTFAVPAGHVGSNGYISLTGGAVVRGDAIPGPNDVVNLSNGTVFGSTTPRATELPLPDPSYEDFDTYWATNDNGNLTASPYYDVATMALNVSGGNTLTLTTGTYFFTDLRLSGGSVLAISGSVTIYATGDVDLSGGAVSNGSGKPEDLIIYNFAYDLPPGYTAPTNATLKLSGGSGAALAVYAPDRHVNLSGGSHLWGALVGKSVRVSGGSSLHYDTALLGIRAGSAQPRRIYWREISLPPR